MKQHPQGQPYKWWNWHDSYVTGATSDPKCVAVSNAGEAAFRKVAEVDDERSSGR